ncbi:MAG: EF-hand domain-containing protein [Desulfovibrio sp.]|jgi:hypothetical protein|nr:EF-hand domain-containing protein [Desulfovibrio sp.]
MRAYAFTVVLLRLFSAFAALDPAGGRGYARAMKRRHFFLHPPVPLLLPFLVFFICAPPALAQVPADRFAVLDADGDGRISRAEFAAGLPHLRADSFAALDADGDGGISREEWRQVRLRHMSPGPAEQGGAGRGPGQGPELILPR